MKKRLRGLFLAIALICMLLPKTSLMVNAETGIETKINEILSIFPAGSFFTVDGNSCGHNSDSTCSNCYVRNVLSSRGMSFSSNYADGWTCFGFATFCFGYIFGQNYMNASGVISSGIISNAAEFYSAFQFAKKGDFVYHWKTGYETNPNHYSIFLDCDTNGVWLLHANTGGGVNRISTSYITYNSLMDGWGHHRVDIYRATNYDEINGPVSHTPTGVADNIVGDVNSVRVTGWAFDEDCPSAQLDIEVYIGGQYHTTIRANNYRPDVNDAYGGIGNYHGYDAWIPTAMSGERGVTIFALNVDKNGNRESEGHKIIGSATVTISAKAPVISDVKIRNVTERGFDVFCTVTDDNTISRVLFPTWTVYNDQDDLLDSWSTNPLCFGTLNGSTASYHVDASAHNGELGLYACHIYAFDEFENATCYPCYIYLKSSSDEYGATVLASTDYNGHTYLLIERIDNRSDCLTWTMASTYCQSLGGTLACITSAEENAVVAALASSYGTECWIGGNDLANNDNVFVWDSGEPFSYQNWAAKQPDNSSGSEYFTTIYPDGTWNDQNDSYKTALICEIETPCIHKYSYEVTKDPTDTEEGTLTAICALCSKSTQYTLPRLTTDNYHYDEISKPTCQNTGTGRYTWNNTAYGVYSFDVTLPLTEHRYASEIIPATCTQYAMTVYTCLDCGDTYSEIADPTYSEWSTEFPEEADPSIVEERTEFRYRDKEYTTSSNSSVDGWTCYDVTSDWGPYGDWSAWSFDAVEKTDYRDVKTQTVYPYYYFYCTTCGTGARYPYSGVQCELCGNYTVPSSTGTVEWYTSPWSNSTQWGSSSKYYQYINGCIVWNWTDGSAQTQYSYCTREKVYTYYFWKWGEWSPWSETQYASSSEREVDSQTVYRYITNPLGEHAWDAGTEIKNATCTVGGTIKYTCNKCGATKEETTAALGHNLTHHDAKAPTCTEIGWDAYDACSRCDYSTYVEKPAFGHNFSDGVCTVCGAKDPDYIVIGDVDGNGEVDTIDSIRLAKYLVDLVELTDEQIKAADVNGDGEVTATDAIRLAKYLVGLVDTLRPEPQKAAPGAAER